MKLSKYNINIVTNINSRAKNIIFKFTKPDEIRLTLPRKFSKKRINKLIEEKKDWIQANQHKIHLHFFQPQTHDSVYIFGQKYTIKNKYFKNKKIGVYRHDNQIIINVLPEMKKNYHFRRMSNFLKNTAQQYLIPRTHQLSKRMKLNFKKIKLKEQKTRWGSCSSLGNLNLNWRLVHFKTNIIDYVIIHELAHLKEANHSHKFWSIVKKYDQDYKKHRKLLKNKQIHIEKFE